MVRKTIVVLTDDLEGGAADRTVTFSLDGISYDIDLNQTNIDNLTKALEPFTNAARKTSRGRAQRSTAANNRNLTQVRAWAREHGFQISDRGRVPKEILDAYQQRK